MTQYLHVVGAAGVPAPRSSPELRRRGHQVPAVNGSGSGRIPRRAGCGSQPVDGLAWRDHPGFVGDDDELRSVACRDLGVRPARDDESEDFELAVGGAGRSEEANGTGLSTSAELGAEVRERLVAAAAQLVPAVPVDADAGAEGGG